MSRKINNIRERDTRMVKGIVRNNERSGGEIEFSFKKYKEDGIKNYSFKDGEEVTIPVMIADHLNNCMYFEKGYTVDMYGEPTVDRGAAKPRFSFVATDFGDIT